MNNSLYKKFLLIWFGQFVSIIGSGLTSFAIGIYIYERTHSAFNFSMVLLCIFLPPLVVKPIGGVLADRFDRKIMILIGDFGAGLGTLYIFYMMSIGRIELWHIYFGVTISSIFGAIQDPAYKASVTDFLSKEQYAKASGLMQLANSAQYLISPFLAGILLEITNIKFIFLIDIATFLFANTTIIIVRKAIGKTILKRPKEKFMVELREGINELSRHKGVVWLVGTTMAVLFFVGLLQSLFIPLLLTLGDSKTAGITQSVCASGMIAGSLFIGVFGSKEKHVKTLAVSLFFSGLFFALIGASTEIIFIALAGFLFFGFLPFVNTSIEVLIRKNIDNEKQGRVWSIVSVITYFGSIIAFIFAGLLADKVFNPLLKSDGALARSIGSFIGIGDNRGIGLMFILSGVIISVISLLILKNSYIKAMESN